MTMLDQFLILSFDKLVLFTCGLNFQGFLMQIDKFVMHLSFHTSAKYLSFCCLEVYTFVLLDV